MAMNVSARTFTWLERRVRAPLLDLKLAFISLSVKSSWKAGGNVPVVLIALPGGLCRWRHCKYVGTCLI